MRALPLAFACASLGGCIEVPEDQLPPPDRHVEHDVEYWKEPNGPGSLADCQASPAGMTFGCENRLRLCDNGVVQLMFADVLIEGTYSLDHRRTEAIATTRAGDMTFDLVTRTSPEYPGDWMLVTDGGRLGCWSSED